MRHLNSTFSQLILCSLLLCSLAGCSLKFAKPKPAATQNREALPQLSQKQAELRKAMVAAVDYELLLDLTGNGEHFNGRVIIQLQMKSVDKPLTIDFTEGEITQLTINEETVVPQYNGFFLTIPAGFLNKGKNTLEVAFRQQYHRDGHGLNRFIDPDDQRSYLSSHFEPYSANKMFPVLDQPDLKASIKLSTRVPEDWQVISTKREQQTIRDGKYRWWYFPASETISPYVFSVHAGPYAFWEDKISGVPLRFFVRQSLQKQTDPEPIFQTTRKGIRFFEQYFDQPFPFSKYDQIMAPGLHGGGMENAAAVTLSEYVLFHHPSLGTQYITQLILHELSHMWFGDQVTLTWWNNLWLNESFAEFFAFKAMDEDLAMTDIWLDFRLNHKEQAYKDDGDSNSHPVTRPVKTTREALQGKSSIIYSKGAALLRQLEKQLGYDLFRQGIREYLQQHAEGNTTLADFINAMETVSGESLEDWSEDLLQTSGINEIKASFSCNNGTLDNLTLHQSILHKSILHKSTLHKSALPEHDQILRKQKISIALMMLKNDQLVTSRVLTATYKGKRTKVQIAGRHPCPAAILPNSDDTGYVQIRLDDQSRQAIMQYRAQEPLQQALLFNSLRPDVLDGSLSYLRYSNRVLALIETEQSPLLKSFLKQRLYSIFYFSQILQPTDKVSRKELTQLADDIESFFWQKTDLSMENNQYWFDGWLNTAHTEQSLDTMALILDGKKVMPTFSLQTYQRWTMIRKLSEYNYPGIEQRIKRELTSDTSADARFQAMKATVSAPSIENKRHWLGQILTNDQLQPRETRVIVHHLLPSSQVSQARFLAGELLDGLEQIKTRDKYFQHRYLSLLVDECSAAGLSRIDQVGKRYKDHPVINNALLRARQRTEQCIRIKDSLKQ